jgi:hypothetical protein
MKKGQVTFQQSKELEVQGLRVGGGHRIRIVHSAESIELGKVLQCCCNLVPQFKNTS